MISKLALLVIIFIGLILITINLTKQFINPQQPEIIYRYIPQTLEEQEAEPMYVSDIFKTMFSQQSPWIFSVQNLDVKRTEEMNKYFVSQY